VCTPPARETAVQPDPALAEAYAARLPEYRRLAGALRR
jgi:hypothetical protein